MGGKGTIHLKFIEIERKPKTKVWKVMVGYLSLGKIKWYPPWRRYVFMPGRDTLFDAGCLNDIETFLNSQMEKRKCEKKEE